MHASYASPVGAAPVRHFHLSIHLMQSTLPASRERSIAVSIVPKGTARETALDHLDELEFLAETAGAEVIVKIVQDRDRPDVATAIGKGKVEEVKNIVEQEAITLALFDDDLSPVQVRNLEKAWNIKVLDRSGLILDIFASRARTVEARTQVELAQLQYLLPRLSRMWTHLSKQFGGIGTKGPGETQIETDRRMLRLRIQRLKEKLEEIATQKSEQRKQRAKMPRFALVGYTNAGKSTLMNPMTGAGVYVENKLFATLDTTTRAFELPAGQKALLSDTVGFIRKLPSHLIASFRTTLSEAAEADVLLHVVDCTHPEFRDHVRVVRATLDDLGLTTVPTILVLNKIDALRTPETLRELEHEFADAIFISAARGINVTGLLAAMQRHIEAQTRVLELLLPYAEIGRIAMLYESGDVLHREDTEEGVRMKIRLNEEEYRRVRALLRNAE